MNPAETQEPATYKYTNMFIKCFSVIYKNTGVNIKMISFGCLQTRNEMKTIQEVNVFELLNASGPLPTWPGDTKQLLSSFLPLAGCAYQPKYQSRSLCKIIKMTHLATNELVVLLLIQQSCISVRTQRAEVVLLLCIIMDMYPLCPEGCAKSPVCVKNLLCKRYCSV